MAQQALPAGQAGPSYGGGAFSGWPESMEAGTDDVHTRSIFDNRNIMLRTDAGDGVGYIRGYQTFAAFQPIQIVPDEFILWMSPRGYITFNSGSFAGNLGTGFRWLDRDTNRIFGAGAWWDHDNNGTNNYDQLGASVEWLGKYLDLRANAYIPTNQNVHVISQFLNNNNVFIGNNIGVGQTTITNTALRGGDFEAGGALPGIGDLGVRTYAGGYYYQGPTSGGGIYGVRARAEALVTQDMWGSVIWQHDRVFGTTVTAAATFYLFTGNEQHWFRRIPMETRLYQQQERQYRVAVEQNVQNDTLLALRNGGTGGSGGPVGTPIFVLHVDNTAAAGGDGSVERPLNHLPTSTATNVDIVFVHSGNGLSTNMDQGITLNNWERLLGAGIPHMFTDTLGTYQLPGYTPGQATPTITNVNPGGAAVTLASHNEVSSFKIPFNTAGQTNQGIVGTGITDFNINNVTITGAGNSTLLPIPTVGAINLTDATGTGIIASSKFLNNINADGIRINNSSGTLDLAVTKTQSSNNLNGMELIADNATINPTVSQFTATNNTRDGIAVGLTSGSSMTGTFDQIVASQNGNSTTGPLGFGNGFTYNSASSSGNIGITRSAFSQNVLNGVNFTTTDNSVLTAALLNNTPTIASAGLGMSNNTQAGVNFNSTDSQVTATLLNNTISNNGGFGIGVAAKGTGAFASSFDLVAGGYLTQDINKNGTLDPGEDQVTIASLGSSILGNGVIDREGNTLISNHGAGISYNLIDQATGTSNIIGNTIQSTLAGQLPQDTTTYIGQGIDVRLSGSSVAGTATASLTGGIIDNNTIGSLTDATKGNAGSGIVISTAQDTSLQNLSIGTVGIGNIIGRNLGDGITVVRANTSHLGDSTPLLITDNTIQANGSATPATNPATGLLFGQGISIAALNSFDNTVTGIIVQNNTIGSTTDATRGNLQNGMLIHVEADAQVDVDILNNIISNNRLTGITTSELAGSPGDLRGVGGSWSGNTITKNGFGGTTAGTDNGIWLTAASGTSLQNLLIGDLVAPADGVSNLIQGNAGHGILIESAGNVDMAYNTIDTNGTGGIYLNALVTALFTIDHNVITNNGNFNAAAGVDGGDGIQVVNQGNSGTIGIPNYNVVITSNTIRNNAGRGINILNQVFGQTSVNIDTNLIANNKLEGIYVVNTASATQSANVTGEVALNADGSVFAAPRLDLVVNNNDIEGNGLNSLLTATGLVVRVGTSDGGSFAPFSDDGGFYNDSVSGPRGGVGATVTNNTLHGNLGDDFSFSSFTSTVDPAGSAGTRDATQLSFTGYQTDPLARLDLSFHNNTFDSTPQNVGNVVNNTNSGNLTTNQVTAGYSNSDAFKSPLFSDTLPGPYVSNTRIRNAERLAGRFLGSLPPFGPQPFGYPFYLYPGMGQSTFRLMGATTAADVAAAGFITDVAPYTNPGDANGVFRAGATVDEMPTGWTFLNGAAAPGQPQ
ncbi:MAG: right-handed parallel beta-helix repeat-containing protein [Planctomycetes bacterium]|nr:right-handed parallel beta-helix repeat-containing protein [Planctomycetota bacterium]